MQLPSVNRSEKSKESGFRIPPFKRAWAIALLLVVLTVVTAVRVRLLDMPLERDEGEYAYVGQLMLQGVPPYQEAYTMKWPGTAAMYALFMGLFGETAGEFCGIAWQASRLLGLRNCGWHSSGSGHNF